MEIASAITFAAISTTTLAIGLGLGYLVLSGILTLMQRGMGNSGDPEGATGVVVPMPTRQTTSFEQVEFLEAA